MDRFSRSISRVTFFSFFHLLFHRRQTRNFLNSFFPLFFFFFFFFLQPFQLPGTSFAGHVSARIKIRPRTTSFEFGGEKDKEKKGSRGVEVGISARAVSKRGLQVSSETHSTREKLWKFRALWEKFTLHIYTVNVDTIRNGWKKKKKKKIKTLGDLKPERVRRATLRDIWRSRNTSLYQIWIPSNGDMTPVSAQGRKKPRDVTERILRIALYFEPRNFCPRKPSRNSNVARFYRASSYQFHALKFSPPMDMEKQVDRQGCLHFHPCYLSSCSFQMFLAFLSGQFAGSFDRRLDNCQASISNFLRCFSFFLFDVFQSSRCLSYA